MKSHDDDLPFKCLQCEVGFNVQQNLILHESIHRLPCKLSLLPGGGGDLTVKTGKKSFFDDSLLEIPKRSLHQNPLPLD